MKILKSKQLVFALLTAGIITSCSSSGGGGSEQQEGRLNGTVNIDGSSTMYPITEAIAEEFRTAAPDVRVTIGVSGTGGGFKKFARGETAVSNASRPIKSSEIT
ncbi:MAG: substrate-binding domain-containing protein [Saprospiraceae bacterium]|nr:substrate-binding domain-containing protein [Saprospiraceae bacterium]